MVVFRLLTIDNTLSLQLSFLFVCVCMCVCVCLCLCVCVSVCVCVCTHCQYKTNLFCCYSPVGDEADDKSLHDN